MKKVIFGVLLMFLTITMVNAESIASGYSLLIRKGDVTESFSTSEVTAETKNAFNNTVSFNNNFISLTNLSADRLSITDASATLSGALNMTISGDNTVNVLSLTSCSLSISGTGTLKFVPSYFGEEGIITNVEEQKQFVSSRIKTSLSITYEDGYIYINKSEVKTESKESVENNTTNTVEENNSNNKEETPKVNDTTNNNVNTENNVSNESVSDNEIEENVTINVDDKDSKNDEKLESAKKVVNKKNNIPLYIGITVGSIAISGTGILIFKKMKLH